VNLNKVIIVGRVTADPQVKALPSGQTVANFSIATNSVWVDKKTGQKNEAVEFHNIVLWNKTAEVAGQYVRKGSLLLVEGRLQTRSWEDKQGVKHWQTEIIGERIQLGPRPVAGAVTAPQKSPGAGPAPAEGIPVVDIEDNIGPEDLPF
jgi:single-strand DNA-binding protein